MVTVGDIEQAPCAQPAAPWEAEHMAALKRGDKFYEDPDTGFMVMTEHAHRSRGKCCGSGCRHCPYAHESVPSDRREQLDHSPVWLVPPGKVASTASVRLPKAVVSGSASQPSNAELATENGTTAASIATSAASPRPVVVLFWSTGKDSFLALRALQRISAGAATPHDPPVNVRLSSFCLNNSSIPA